MSKHRTKSTYKDYSEYGVGSPTHRHVSATYDFLDSEVYNSLSLAAIAAFFNIHRNFNGYNHDNITCTRDKLCRKLSPTVWLNATKELEEKGIIDIVRRIGGKYPNIYQLSNRWKEVNKKLLAEKATIKPKTKGIRNAK